MKLSFTQVGMTDGDYHTLLVEVQEITRRPVYPFGSRYTVADGYHNDTDILVDASEDKEEVIDALIAEGFESTVDRQYAGASGLSSYRKGHLNAILIYDSWEFLARAAACELCRAQGFTDRQDRRYVHHTIADVERADPNALFD